MADGMKIFCSTKRSGNLSEIIDSVGNPDFNFWRIQVEISRNLDMMVSFGGMEANSC